MFGIPDVLGIKAAVIAGSVALVVGTAGGAFATYKVMHNANLAAQAQQAKSTVQHVVTQGRITVEVGELVIRNLNLATDETSRRQQEIPRHVTTEIDRTFPVPLGFVRVWNDATHGPIPGPAAGGDADPSGVPLSDVAHAHTADQGTLDVCRVQLAGWWEWYDRQKAAWNKATGQ
jgi:hypothetical protein